MERQRQQTNNSTAVATRDDISLAELGLEENASADQLALALAAFEGDLGRLSPRQRVIYMDAMCASMGLNPLTRPINWIKGEGGSIVPYFNAGCTRQLRKIHGINFYKTEITIDERFGTIEAMVYARDREGNEDVDIGGESLWKYRMEPVTDEQGNYRVGRNGRYIMEYVYDEHNNRIYEPLTGKSLVDAKKKAVTQAKRRVVVSLVGFGNLAAMDMSDAEARRRLVHVDQTSGELTYEGHTVEVEAEPDEAPAPRVIDSDPAERAKSPAEHIADIFGGRPAHGERRRPPEVAGGGPATSTQQIGVSDQDMQDAFSALLTGFVQVGRLADAQECQSHIDARGWDTAALENLTTRLHDYRQAVQAREVLADLLGQAQELGLVDVIEQIENALADPEIEGSSLSGLVDYAQGVIDHEKEEDL